ncbi:MAG: beta-ketoacyl-[acyl-carrier-protein] synthase II [Candidatus Melainabacteria bacterium RIFCSPHIGHO2_02_FULL_34_12]|nr:MAG: beta-ketoacyl-[acyl-carrier-protein] synthase II [Candidatus Melainabacteria bacterium RIFCSPHIGHO2_02_FULL_34_12]
MKKRVVITGIGPVTNVGIGNLDFWSNLKAGKSGVSRIQSADSDEWKAIDISIAGEIKDFSPEKYFNDPKLIKSMQKDMDKVTQFAVVAAKLAIEDASLDFTTMNTERVSTFVGTGIGGINTTCNDQIIMLKYGQKKMGVRSIIRLMPNAPSGYIGILWGLKGRAKNDSTACASGLDSMLDALNWIRLDKADIVITGGTECTINPLSMASFSNMGALSKRQCPPEMASCPFSKERDGFVMGEGAIIFAFEELEHAKKRGAKIYAEVIGGGATCDASHITAPHETGDGAARAMIEALKDGEIKPEEINYIHAHGTSTPLNDARETMAIKKVFGEHAKRLAVSSSKSMTGHLIGAAGPCGVAVCAHTIKNGIITPTINYQTPDPDCDLDYVPNKAREQNVNAALISSLGFGGHNTVLALKKYS